ncbi:hypothetical protein [Maricaulis sp. CAU 1757]
MSDLSPPPKPDWLNRFIALAVALMCLVFGIPVAAYGLVALWAAATTLQVPTLGHVLALVLGLALVAGSAAIAWRTFVPAPGRSRGDKS